MNAPYCDRSVELYELYVSPDYVVPCSAMRAGPDCCIISPLSDELDDWYESRNETPIIPLIRGRIDMIPTQFLRRMSIIER